MSVEVLDSATIVSFVEDEEAFDAFIGDRFSCLDKPDPDELARVYSSLFVQFDHDANGSVDLEEFKAETRRMMLAMADDLGFLPVQMVLEEDSFLKKAVERELTKVPA
ncbi:hypothetical protein NL676_000631 [Syzygium grande]|nr:hypothetical protein NL676_000631 [Syzygium grande]